VLSIVAVVPLAIICIVVIPNILTSVNRTRQRRSMAGVRDWAEALEHVDHRVPSSIIATSDEVPSTHAPRRDGWGHPFRIELAKGRARITSAGRDGLFQRHPAGGPTKSLDDDIIYADGGFVQFPEGI
jgi:type II secretory pathway pseudopilin PulG